VNSPVHINQKRISFKINILWNREREDFLVKTGFLRLKGIESHNYINEMQL